SYCCPVLERGLECVAAFQEGVSSAMDRTRRRALIVLPLALPWPGARAELLQRSSDDPAACRASSAMTRTLLLLLIGLYVDVAAAADRVCAPTSMIKVVTSL